MPPTPEAERCSSSDSDLLYTKRSHPSWLCEIREAAESDSGVIRHPLPFLAFSGASRKEKGRG